VSQRPPDTSNWLVLREPIDRRSRSLALARLFADGIKSGGHLVDIAAGTGSNLRYLAPLLANPCTACAVDLDADLLHAISVDSIPATTRIFDLQDGIAALALPKNAALTTSAFLDMCSAPWLDQFARDCEQHCFLAAMTFDGVVEWNLPAPHDREVNEKWLATRMRDQGLGPALGPHAATYLIERLRVRGHQVEVRRSDWILGVGDERMLKKLIDGIAARVHDHQGIDDWLHVRTRQLAANELRLRFGHVDFLAYPRSG
jgi:hypothetical protein